MNKFVFALAALLLCGCSKQPEPTTKQHYIAAEIFSDEATLASGNSQRNIPPAPYSEGDEYMRSHTKKNNAGFGTKGGEK